MSRDMNETIEYLPPQSLGVAPQVRKRVCPEEEAGLMQSIREVGILQPIRARIVNDKPFILDGHRRTAAAIKLGMTAVPVIVERTALSESAAMQRQLIANVQRSDLSPLEKATAIAQLMQAEKWSAAQAANKLGMSAPSVSRLLALLQLPPEIRSKVATGEIPVSAAYELAQVGDATQRNELAQQVAAGTLTRDGLTAARKSRGTPSPATAETKPLRVIAKLGAQRTVAVSAVGLTLERFIEQLEELLGKARKARPQGLELGTFIKMLADQSKA